MLKNAIAYILRKRNRTIIVFIILTVVLSCLYSCLNITKSTSNLEKNLYKISNTSLSIIKNNGDTFETNQFKELNNIKEIKEIITNYDGLTLRLKWPWTTITSAKIPARAFTASSRRTAALQSLNGGSHSLKRNSRISCVLLPSPLHTAIGSPS